MYGQKTSILACWAIHLLALPAANDLKSQGAFWFPPKDPSMPAEQYEQSKAQITKSFAAIRDTGLSQFEKKIAWHNVFIGHLKLKSPRDTTLKYLNLALLYGSDLECHNLVTENKDFFESFISGYDNFLWNIICQRCSQLYARYDSGLIATLEKLRADDQNIRTRLEELHNPQFAGNDPNANSLWKEQLRLDSINQKKAEAILLKYGYPGRSMVGEAHCAVVFNVIQHAPPALKEKYCYLIEAAAHADQIDPVLLCYLTDRMNMEKEIPQVYGTQFIYNEKSGKMEMYPVKNLKTVDALRKKVGLEPLSAYMKKNDITNFYKK